MDSPPVDQDRFAHEIAVYDIFGQIATIWGSRHVVVRNALIVHAVAAPVIFAAATFIYFKGAPYTTPLQTAIIYVYYFSQL